MLSRLKLQLRALFHRNELERELDEELRFHLEKEIEQNVSRGMKLRRRTSAGSSTAAGAVPARPHRVETRPLDVRCLHVHKL